MNTNFFSAFHALKLYGKFQLHLTVSQQDMRVCIIPVIDGNDTDTNPIQPLTFKKKTPAELDAGFFDSITQPLQETAGLLANLEAYKKSVQKATQPKPDSTKTGTSSSPVKSNAPTPPAKYTKALLHSRGLEQKGMVGQAIAAMPKAEEFPALKAEIDQRMAELKAKHGGFTELSLFGDEPAAASANPTASAEGDPAGAPPQEQAEGAAAPASEEAPTERAAAPGLREEDGEEEEDEDDGEKELAAGDYPPAWDEE